MNEVLYLLLHDLLFFKKYRPSIKDKFIQLLKSGDGLGFSKDDWEEAALEEIVNATLYNYLKYSTRQSFKLVSKIKAKCKAIREKRYNTENYLKISFKAKAVRSLGEVRFICSKERLRLTF